MFCCPLIRQLLNTFCLKYDRFWDETIFEKLLNLVFVWQNVPPSSRFSATGKMVIISWCIVLQTETVEVELMNWIFICYSWSMRTSIMKRNICFRIYERGAFFSQTFIDTLLWICCHLWRLILGNELSFAVNIFLCLCTTNLFLMNRILK